MALLSDKQQRDLLIALGLLDFVTRGRVNAAAFDLSLATLKRVFPVAARAGVSVAGSVGRAAIPIATNPYLAGAALGYGALQTEPGQQLLESVSDSGRMARIQYEQALTDLEIGVKAARKRTKSKFNKMVSAGMKKVKASTSYGKKGTISNAKKAFSVVTKAASAVTKGHKLPKSGIKRILMSMMRRIR